MNLSNILNQKSVQSNIPPYFQNKESPCISYSYTRSFALKKKEDVELDTLSEWVKSIGDVVNRRIRRLKHSVNTISESIFRDPDLVHELSRLHENFVIVPADKTSNSYVYLCLQETLRRHPDRGTWTPFTFWESYIQSDGFFCIRSVGQPQIGPYFLRNTDRQLWTRFALHTLDSEDAQNPYKHRFIAGSSKCSTKPLSILLKKLLTHIKQGLKKYCETAFSRSGINQMWILKNSKELLDHLKSPNFNLITNNKSFDFSTLYTTIPNQKLKSRLATIIRNSFIHTLIFR